MAQGTQAFLAKAGASALALLLLSGCSLSQEESPREQDRVTFKVTGTDGRLLDNVNETLSALPAIPARRARSFTREIRDKTALALRALGYYHPGIEITVPERDSFSREVEVQIDPGKPLYIREAHLEILGEGAGYASFRRLLERSGIKPYAVLDHGAYEKLKADLRANAMALGFFDAKLLYSRIMVYDDQNRADIALVLDTGKRYSFGALIADAQTQELLEPAQSLFTLNRGTPFSSKALNDFQSSMSQTGFYRSVDVQPRTDKLANREVPLELHLERKSKNLMRLGAGYSTDERFRMLAEWDKPLLNRYGHSLSTYARISAIKRNAEVIYKIPRKDPNLDYYYVRLAQLHTDFNDTLSDLSHASFHYVQNHTGKWRRDWSLRAEYEDYTQGSDSGTAVNLMPGIQLSRRESSGGQDPHFGYSVSGDFSGGTRAFSDYDFFRAVLSFRGVLSPTENTRFIFRLTQGITAGRDAAKVPPSLRFFAGGDRSVRGFGYMSKAPRNSGGLNGGKYLSLGSAEFQFPVGIENSRGAVFLDAGKAYSKTETGDMLWGPGIGYRYVSGYGTVSVDLACGISDDDTSFKLHFAFGPEF